MHPAFHVLGREVGAYIAFLVPAILAGVVVFVVAAPVVRMSRRRAIISASVVVVCGIIGSKLGSVILEGAKPFSSLGFTYMGALVFSVPALVAAIRSSGLRTMAVLDLAAIASAVGLAIGRFGCLFGGCCWGRPTLFPIALVYEDFAAAARPIGVPLHATPLYESIGALMLFGSLLAWFLLRRPLPGLIFCRFLEGYSILRFGLEFLRADPRGPQFAGLSPPQITCCLLFAAALCLERVLAGRRPLTARTAPPPTQAV